MLRISQTRFLKGYMKMLPLQYKIVIYGAGENGVKLSECIRECGRKADAFCDNNPEKTGKDICGIPCISYEELKQEKDQVIVFVSPSDAKDIYSQLETEGFPFIVPEEIKDVWAFCPPPETALFPVGHFYSLYPDLREIEKKRKDIFNKDREVKDIFLNEEHQCEMLKNMLAYYDTLPKWEKYGEEEKSGGLRYRYGNPSLSSGDAVALHCMIRMLKPNRLIEVGSGFSSALILDTNEEYLNNKMKCCFIEPYAALLKSLCKDTDNIFLRECGLQEVELEFFDQLESGDILFIDSTHVSKVGSDVNYLFFEIFPRLKQGVYIHLHDIFYPFEYPETWIMEKGMIWNELYLLRAFLQNNREYSIEFFHNMLEQKHMDLFMEKWPFEEMPHGGSIWLQKR
ncbi:MAG: class I SAM-dependent methyltransferase [Lachnospiraceae bacterium]